MPVVARLKGKINHWSLTPVLAACLVLCSFGGTTKTTASSKEVTLRLVPLKAAAKEGEAIAIKLVFVGGADETTLTLPMGADASGIITCRAIDIASGREWAVTNRDPRSFAADARRRLPAGESIELHRDALEFEAPDNPFAGKLARGQVSDRLHL